MVGNQESTSSTFWFQPVWGLHASVQLTSMGILVSVKQLKGILSIVCEEELKVLDFV